jgi:transcriptional regulator with XRE-family HTH domain
MAAKLGITQSMVSDVEGSRKNVTMDLLEAYSSGVGIRMSQLLFFAEEIEGQPIARRGQLIVADKVIKLLERLKPNEHEEA